MSESGSNEGKEESQSKRQRVQQEESNVVSSANVPLEIDIDTTIMQNFPNSHVQMRLQMPFLKKYLNESVRNFLTLNPDSEFDYRDDKVYLNMVQNMVLSYLPEVDVPCEHISELNLAEKIFYVGEKHEEFGNLSFNPQVGSFSPPEVYNKPLAMAVYKQSFHKVLVVSGESGAGKSVSAAKRFPQLIIKPVPHSKTFVFHLSTVPSKIHQDELVNDDIRNEIALDLLQYIWSNGLKQLESFLRGHKGWNEKFWKSINIVMIIDELGPYPKLLRGLVSMANEMEMEAIKTVLQFRLICVGTAIDWGVKENDVLSAQLIATLPEKYHLVRMIPWNQVDKKRFLDDILSAPMTESGSSDSQFKSKLIDAVLRLQFTNHLLGNARCATLLAKYLQTIRVTADPEHTVYLHRALIFRDVAEQYKSLNGLEKHFAKGGGAARKDLFSLLQTMDNNPNITNENFEMFRKFVTMGLLTYNKDNFGTETVSMSPAILLMLLSGFGWKDIAVLDGEDFEQMVALRELAKICAVDSEAKVEIVVLNNPLPPTKSNSELRKETTEETPTRKCTFSLPRSHFCWDAENCSFRPNVDDTWYIIVNGAKAPAADVIILPPLINLDLTVKVIQAKKYKQESPYKPSIEDVMKELSKFGLAPVSYPATFLAFQTLLKPFRGHGNQQYAFVLSSSGTHLQLQLQELRSQLAKKAQDENMKRITDGAACAAIEEISATWKQLVLDSSPALPTIEVECMKKKNEEVSFREVKQSEDDDEVEIILE